MAYASVVGPIAQKIRDAAEVLDVRVWGFQRPKSETLPTLPFVVVLPLGEVPTYRSKARHSTQEDVQVSIFASSAEEGGEIFDTIDQVLTYAPLELSGTAACVRVYYKGMQRLPIEQGVTQEGADLHHWAVTYTVIVERDTPNK